MTGPARAFAVAVAGLALLGCSSSAPPHAEGAASSGSGPVGCNLATLTWPGHVDVPVICGAAPVEVSLGLGDFLDAVVSPSSHASADIVTSNPGVLRAGPTPTDEHGRPDRSTSRFTAVASGTSGVRQGEVVLATVTVV